MHYSESNVCSNSKGSYLNGSRVVDSQGLHSSKNDVFRHFNSDATQADKKNTQTRELHHSLESKGANLPAVEILPRGESQHMHSIAP